MNPMEWFRRTMAPQIREDSAKEVEEARKKLRETGEGSLFETVAEEEATSRAAAKAKKEKATSVRLQNP
jgi:hypothetical protein